MRQPWDHFIFIMRTPRLLRQHLHIYGLVQDSNISIANALERRYCSLALSHWYSDIPHLSIYIHIDGLVLERCNSIALSSLVQIMACRLVGAKPLSEPMLDNARELRLSCTNPSIYDMYLYGGIFILKQSSQNISFFLLTLVISLPFTFNKANIQSVFSNFTVIVEKQIQDECTIFMSVHYSRFEL